MIVINENSGEVALEGRTSHFTVV